MASMISRRHRAVVVKVAFVVGVLYLMGMLRIDRDTPSEEEERGNAEESDPSVDQSGEGRKIEEPNVEPPKLEPPILELPDVKDAESNAAQQNEIEDTQSEEKAKEKKRLEEKKEAEKMKLEEKEEEKAVEKEKQRLEEKAEEKAEDKELDLVVAPPKIPEGPGEMGKPYKVRKKTTKL